MHFASILIMLPLALAAPSPALRAADQVDMSVPEHTAAGTVDVPVFAAQHASHAHRRSLTELGSPGHAKRQVKVRRPAQKRGSEDRRACSAPPAAGQAPSSSNNGDAVFPVAVRNSWTTVQGRSGSLSFDDALKPLAAGKLPPAQSAPDGSWALQASYPAGTVKYSSATGHGYSFYSKGEKSGVDVTSATEVLFSYAVYFSSGFDFVRGGKLPGLYGGASADEAKSCSGGRQDQRDRCFSARMMWRTDGAGELYNYLPISGQQPAGYCFTAPMSVCDANFGDSIGRGAFYFPTGQWTTVTQRLRLNSPASASNGEQELFVNGKSVIKLSGLQLRVTDETKIYGIMAQTFFGGSDQSWASPKDQWAWFKDWSLGVVY